ncbi:MAG: ATP-binding protein [Syntrophobacteraceae bacterium]|jgi:magnesium chelatase subunit I|nr:ATP-binding protein [Syntrophobacteraceae bacterium]
MSRDIPTYPFAAIVGQESMKLALILNIINPKLSGVLVRGEKGTAKSTAVRSLAEILPSIPVVPACPFQMGEEVDIGVCSACSHSSCAAKQSGAPPERVMRKVAVVDLPLGATEDRVVGTLDLEHALKAGEKRFEPGILAAAHRGVLYVDEVNLLDDHIVDVLLDSAAMGVNTVEREGISFTHPARFTLVGTMNPEEGELRPQLLDRFGLCVQIEGIRDPEERVRIMERRAAFDENPERFREQWRKASREISRRIGKAARLLPGVKVHRDLLMEIATCCVEVGVDGHRGDIIVLKTAKTLAAYGGRREVTREDVERGAELALPHRVRRQPLQEIATDIQVSRRNRSA